MLAKLQSNRILSKVLVASVLFSLGLGLAEAQPVVIMERPMPAVRVEVVPPPPRVGVSWVPGHWVWRGGAWFWARGHYVEGVVPPMPVEVVETRPVAPSPAHFWVKGHWDWEGGQWIWHPGVWIRR
ncbi:YXWGXW repeat-containing protein [Methylovirgula sp. 4M-Z18]|uniref:YXWGXW repeat-containing protein n=1 Tax=Methylovirgula sp. 4M-Z18 TaxID=2293567 RepID=UPI000E2F6789|nr:YXWGXW repeat-containing protein [Methylovirgula sp. 4M-Z18]RFB80832.1 hypothetical protein DYH55_04980 [Methylovirgula sp. 4M-Z18]